MVRMGIEKPPDHSLILRVAPPRLALEEFDTRVLKAIVTLTPSSRKTRPSGGGRKSRMIFSLPSGSSVHLIFTLIGCRAPSPVARANDSDHVVAGREADRQHSAFDSTEAVVPPFARAMRQILCDHTARISEGKLRLRTGDAVLPLVLLIPLWVPLEEGPSPLRKGSHGTILRAIRSCGIVHAGDRDP